MTRDRSWADLVVEETLEPDLPICDPHHHFWVHREGGHLRDERYLIEDLIVDTSSGHNIVSTVFIECRAEYRTDGPLAMRPLGETEFVRAEAEKNASGELSPTRAAAGIIGHVDLTIGERAREVLEAQIAAGGGRFRGIRHSVSWDASDAVRNAYIHPPERQYYAADFRQGFAHLAPLGLTFEGWLYHPQLGDLADLARAFPATTIILNHLGGPLGIGPYAGRRDEVFADWKRSISELAGCPNVNVKLGGIQMDINGFGWEERDRPPGSAELAGATRRYYDHAIEAFGVSRAMFESNFPVDRLSCGYAVLWNAFKRIAAGFSADEKAALFHDTATRVYRL